MLWLQERLNNLLDGVILALVLAGGAALVTLINGLPWYVIIGIVSSVFIVTLFLIRIIIAKIYLRFIIKKLLSMGIFTDVPDNVLRVLYHDRDKLKIGLSYRKVLTSDLDKLVYGDMITHGIVRLQQLSTGDYLTLTKLGGKVILYLENNPQVLHKEGSRHK